MAPNRGLHLIDLKNVNKISRNPIRKPNPNRILQTFGDLHLIHLKNVDRQTLATINFVQILEKISRHRGAKAKSQEIYLLRA